MPGRAFLPGGLQTSRPGRRRPSPAGTHPQRFRAPSPTGARKIAKTPVFSKNEEFKKVLKKSCFFGFGIFVPSAKFSRSGCWSPLGGPSHPPWLRTPPHNGPLKIAKKDVFSAFRGFLLKLQICKLSREVLFRSCLRLYFTDLGSDFLVTDWSRSLARKGVIVRSFAVLV